LARPTSTLCQRVDFRIGRKTAGGFLGKFELPVDGDLEHAAARTDELDIGLTKL
jgi:hypothetical protein